MPSITVQQLYQDQKEALRLRLVSAGKQTDKKLTRKIKVPEVNRPGLALKGYYSYFAAKRVQVLGKAEISYLNEVESRKRRSLVRRLCDFNFPCLVISRRLSIPKELKEEAHRRGIPILQSSLSTSKISASITFYLEEQFSPSMTVSGTLLDVYGVGVMLCGKSGIGKSESALELIKRGHRLVTDDIVHLKLTARRLIVGSGSDMIHHHMEIRGLGIIDIERIFGSGAIRNQKIISFVVTLAEWNKHTKFDRLGLDTNTMTLLGQKIPHYTIPIRPGRNVAILIEVAASNERLRRMGTDSAKEFEAHLLRKINKQPHAFGI